MDDNIKKKSKDSPNWRSLPNDKNKRKYLNKKMDATLNLNSGKSVKKFVKRYCKLSSLFGHKPLSPPSATKSKKHNRILNLWRSLKTQKRSGTKSNKVTEAEELAKYYVVNKVEPKHRMESAGSSTLEKNASDDEKFFKKFWRSLIENADLLKEENADEDSNTRFDFSSVLGSNPIADASKAKLKQVSNSAIDSAVDSAINKVGGSVLGSVGKTRNLKKAMQRNGPIDTWEEIISKWNMYTKLHNDDNEKKLDELLTARH